MDIYLIYASTSGNVEIVMEEVAKVLKANGFAIFLSRVEVTPIETVSKNSKFVFGTSTWEHGLLNPFFERLYGELSKIDCLGKQAAFVGLGDRRYEPVLFCEGAEKVRRLWIKAGGREIDTILKIQGEPYEQIDSAIVPWAGQVAESFKKMS